MLDPQRLLDDASHAILHAWVASYVQPGRAVRAKLVDSYSEQFQTQATRLRESAILLQAALEKMRLANERLAARMAEHRAFFTKYQAPE